MTKIRPTRLTKSWAHNRFDIISDAVRGKTVCHVGCLDWPYTANAIEDGTWCHFLVRKHAKEVLGVDVSAPGLSIARLYTRTDDIWIGDIESLDTRKTLGRFEVVLLSEVIEHVNSPVDFLRASAALMEPDGTIVLTTQNAFGLRRMLGVAVGKEFVHEDHVAYYSERTLTALAERADLELVQVTYYGVAGRLYTELIERLVGRLLPQCATGIVVWLKKYLR